jgi:hypothetical protein
MASSLRVHLMRRGVARDLDDGVPIRPNADAVHRQDNG